jgi:hypothetical protein
MNDVEKQNKIFVAGLSAFYKPRLIASPIKLFSI